MSTIGKFRTTNPADPLRELIGQVRTARFDGRLAITRENAGGHPNAPTHRVYLIDEVRGRIEVGAAWIQRFRNRNREGEEFLSVSIDDPSFPEPLSFAVFQDDEVTWIANWRRRKAAS